MQVARYGNLWSNSKKMPESGGRLIFFVDDDRVILNLVEYIFQSKNGYRVRTFASGEECLENLHLNPDLLVLDYYFADNGNTAMDGLEILKKVKAKNENIPVIVLSGIAGEAIRDEFLAMGAKSFIPKNNFFIDVLEQAISEELINNN